MILISGMSLVIAGDDCGSLLPPRASFRGLSFEEWNVLWSRRTIELNFAETTNVPETLKRVRFLPSVVTPGNYEFDVNLPPGTGFVTAPFFIYGERFDDPAVPDDTPQLIVDLKLFETADIQVILDGRVLLKGTGADLHRWHFGPTYFKRPIVYAEPQFRFNNEAGNPVNAVEALFVEGIGTVYSPLSRGRHTLIQNVSSPFFGEFHYVYHLNVSR
ncbi:hypothetical protein EP7_000438 [Isosphaeraceae bacterium EP7]